MYRELNIRKRIFMRFTAHCLSLIFSIHIWSHQDSLQNSPVTWHNKIPLEEMANREANNASRPHPQWRGQHGFQNSVSPLPVASSIWSRANSLLSTEQCPAIYPLSSQVKWAFTVTPTICSSTAQWHGITFPETDVLCIFMKCIRRQRECK